MLANKLVRRSLLVAILVCAMLLPTAVVMADSHLPPVPIVGPRVEPAPIPIMPPSGSAVRVEGVGGFDAVRALPPVVIYNYVTQSLPPQSAEAAAVAKAQDLGASEYGIIKDEFGWASGTTLYEVSTACNTFNTWEDGKAWGEGGNWSGYTWTNQYAGWGPYAIDDGYYVPEVVTFDMERVVGPGNEYDKNQHAAKIASAQPYAAGLASPIFEAPAGTEVTVEVYYLIFNHQGVNEKDWDYDWASLGVKPDAYGDTAVYVNGYTRGHWALMSNTITVGHSGQFMVLLGASSPAALNSNIYFDNVVIKVGDMYMANCEY